VAQYHSEQSNMTKIPNRQFSSMKVVTNRYSDFTSANFSGADFSNSDLSDSYLCESNLTNAGADLSKSTMLTKQQIDSAIISEYTKLPGHLKSKSQN
jgi:uncharacterized protein YjbI with pentapeptide repeats